GPQDAPYKAFIGRNRARVERSPHSGGSALPLLSDREDGCRRNGCPGLGRSVLLPAEGAAGERLEPGLVLRVGSRRLELEVKVRAARVAGVPDEPDGRPRLELGVRR